MQSVIAEFGYSFMAALKKFQYDADIEMFLKVITGRISEEIYHEQVRQVNDLIKMCTHADKESNGKITKLIDRHTVLASIHRKYSKTNKRMKALQTALEKDQPKGKMVDYSIFFQEDREGN